MMQATTISPTAPRERIPPLQEFLEVGIKLFPLTVEQYHQMLEKSILEEGAPIELLDGLLVRKDRSHAGEDPMTVGHNHAWVLGRINRWILSLESLGAELRLQQPVTISPFHEPEPDAAIVDPAVDYRQRHPQPADIFCLIEVSDGSLRHDRTTKKRIYADAGIPQFIIIDLEQMTIEEYRIDAAQTGRYAQPILHRKGDRFAIILGGGNRFDVAVDTLLP
ncbi:MAG TPA: Uma2 family endonuclease [Tepidisphaeraceae bacterium]